LLALLKVVCRIAKCVKSHSNGDSKILHVATDIVETMLGESYAKELRKILLCIKHWGKKHTGYFRSCFFSSWGNRRSKVQF